MSTRTKLAAWLAQVDEIIENPHGHVEGTICLLCRLEERNRKDRA